MTIESSSTHHGKHWVYTPYEDEWSSNGAGASVKIFHDREKDSRCTPSSRGQRGQSPLSPHFAVMKPPD
jgi:hypothetical protein